MNIKRPILRLMSYIIKTPIPIGSGISFIDSDEADNDTIILDRNMTYVKKYQLKNNLGHFALESIVEKNKVTFYKLIHISTGKEFTISKSVLDLIFDVENKQS